MEMNTPGTKDRILTFLVPANKCHTALNSCHSKLDIRERQNIQSLKREVLVARDGSPGNPIHKELWKMSLVWSSRSLPEMVTISGTEPLDLVHMDL